LQSHNSHVLIIRADQSNFFGANLFINAKILITDIVLLNVVKTNTNWRIDSGRDDTTYLCESSTQNLAAEGISTWQQE